MDAPRRILLIRLSALGDVVLATPAARALKRRFPEARIDWLVEAAYAPLLERNPHVTVIPYDKRGAHAGAAGLWRLRRELARARYDLVVDLQAKPKTAWLRQVAPRALVLRKRTFWGNVASLFGHDPPVLKDHATTMALRLLAPLGCDVDDRRLDLILPEAAKAEAARVWGDGRASAPQVGIAVSARWPTKCWSLERFASLTAQLVARGVQPVLLGGPGDGAAFDAIRAVLPEAAPAVDTGSLSVGGLAAAIDRCDAVIGGDSGPLHLAAALGKPVVALFGPTDPARWSPVADRLEVLRVELPCSPCSNFGGRVCPEGHHDCMRRIEVGSVLAAVERALA